MARKGVNPPHQAKVPERGNSGAQATPRKRGRESTSLLSRTAKRPRTRNQERQASLFESKRPKRSSQTKPHRRLIPPPVPWWKLGGFSSEEEARRTYFDKLPPVPPCRRFLEEHNRRNETLSPKTALSLVTRPLQSIDIRHPSLRLKKFSRGGGPDLTSLRGFRESLNIPEMPASKTQTPGDLDKASRHPSPSKRVSWKQGSTRVTQKDGLNTEDDLTSKTKSVSTQSKAFRIDLQESGIYTSDYRFSGKRYKSPVNIRQLQDIMNKDDYAIPGTPKKPTKKFFNQYRETSIQAESENEVFVKNHLWRHFIGTRRSAYTRGTENITNNLAPFVDQIQIERKFDYVESASDDQLEWIYKLERSLSEKLRHTLFPNTGYTWAVPNLTAEIKRPGRGPKPSSCQAALAGAIGARAMQDLRLLERPQSFQRYDNKAYSISATFDGSELRIFSIHQAKPRAGSSNPIYVTTLLDRYHTSTYPDDLFRGLRAFKNLSKWCQEQRDLFIDEARERALPGAMNSIRTTPPSSMRSISDGDELSDEGLDYDSEGQGEEETGEEETGEESEDELSLKDSALAASFAESQMSSLSASSAKSDDSQRTLRVLPRNKRKASPKLGEQKSGPRENKRNRRYEEFSDDDDDNHVDLINDD